MDRVKTKERLPELSRTDLLWLLRKGRKELKRRYEAEVLQTERVASGARCMANFMAGVTWALACRDSLRRSKSHTPTGGVRPASGEMWLPWEVLTALRAEIKERRWSPLGSRDWLNVLNWLTIEARRQPERVPPPGTFGAVQFRIPFARTEAVVHIDLGSEDRFGS